MIVSILLIEWSSLVLFVNVCLCLFFVVVFFSPFIELFLFHDIRTVTRARMTCLTNQIIHKMYIFFFFFFFFFFEVSVYMCH